MNTEPLNSALTSPSVSSNINPLCGSTDAVTEPEVILLVTNASSVSAERGMLVNP